MSTPDMSCDRARRLFDDYLEYRLGKRDRVRLENHVARCPGCGKELRARPALEHQVRMALGSSVQSLALSPDAGARIVQAAQGSARRGIWLNRALIGGRVLAGAASVMLLVVGLAYLLSRTLLPWSRPAEPPSVSQVTRAPVVPVEAVEIVPDAMLELGELRLGESLPATPAGTGQGQQGQPLTYALVIEPALLHVGDAFTTTVLVRNEQEQPLPVSQVSLDIEGPQRNYHFDLAVSEPLPAERDLALRITPDALAEAIQERYQVSPDQILSTPGRYTIRVTLFHAATAPSGHSNPGLIGPN